MAVVNPESPIKKGNRRSLLDRISLLVENENPLYSLFPKGPKPNNLTYEWPVDKEVAPKDNAVPDGHDFAEFEDHGKDYGILKNMAQLMQRGSMVTKFTQVLTNTAGIPSHIGRQKLKALQGMIADIEAAIGSDNEMNLPTGSSGPGNGGHFRGMGVWMQNGAQSINPVPEAYRMATDQIIATNLGDWTEAAFKTMMQSNYLKTGRKKSFQAVMGAKAKTATDDWTIKAADQPVSTVMAFSRTWERSAEKRMLGDVVDRLISSFGAVNIFTSNRLAAFSGTGHPERRVYVFDPENWDLCLIQPVQYHELPDLGGGPRFYYDAMVGLRCYNPLSGGKVAVSADS